MIKSVNEYDYLRHPHTVRQLAEEIKRVCDDHRNRLISDDVLSSVIVDYSMTESEKLFAGEDFSTAVEQIIGKRRINLITKLLNENQSKMQGGK